MEAVPRGASSETTYVAREAGERIQMGRSGRLKSFGTHDHQRSRTCAALFRDDDCDVDRRRVAAVVGHGPDDIGARLAEARPGHRLVTELDRHRHRLEGDFARPAIVQERDARPVSYARLVLTMF